jgi:hypothetical protein
VDDTRFPACFDCAPLSIGEAEYPRQGKVGGDPVDEAMRRREFITVVGGAATNKASWGYGGVRFAVGGVGLVICGD